MFLLRRNACSIFSALARPSTVVRTPRVLPRTTLPSLYNIATIVTMMGSSNRPPAPPSPKVFIGNLPYSIYDEEIEELLSPYKPEHINMSRDASNRSTGYCHVTFGSIEAADALLDALRNRELQLLGRYLYGEYARMEMTPAKHEPSQTVFVGNIPFNADEKDLDETFREFGVIERISIAYDANRRSRGFAHVEFRSLDAAKRCIEAMPTIQGRSIRYDYAPEKTPKSMEPHHKLYFYGFTGNESDMKAGLRPHEKAILSVYFLRDRMTDKISGTGFIDFISVNAATDALNDLNGTETPGGALLNLTYARPPRQLTNDQAGQRSMNNDWPDRPQTRRE